MNLINLVQVCTTNYTVIRRKLDTQSIKNEKKK